VKFARCSKAGARCRHESSLLGGLARIAGLLLLLSVAAEASESVRFRLMTSFDAPVPGARLTLFDRRHNVATPAIGRTDDQGRVRLRLPHDNVQVRIEAYGYVFWQPLPAPDTTGERVLTLPYQRVRVAVELDETLRRRLAERPFPYRIRTPKGEYAGIGGLISPGGRSVLSLPERPYRIEIELFGQTLSKLWRGDARVRFDVAIVSVTLAALTSEGAPLQGVRARLLAPDGQVAAGPAPTDGNGAVEVRVPVGDYRLQWLVGESVLHEESVSFDGGGAHTSTLDVVPFRWRVRTPGMQTPDVAFALHAPGDEHASIRFPLRRGVVRGLWRAGVWRVRAGAGAWAWPVTTVRLPAQARARLTLPLAPVELQVQTAAGRSFGPARVAASTGTAPPRQVGWTDYDGRARFALPPRPVTVTVQWFDQLRRLQLTPPATETVVFALPRRTLPSPAGDASYLYRLVQDDFRVWAAGTSGQPVALPLAAGQYRIRHYDRARNLQARGTLQITGRRQAGALTWDSQRRVAGPAVPLPWPEAADIGPSAEVAAGDEWQQMEVDDRGRIRAPDGTRLRVPAGPLGRVVRVRDGRVPIALGVLAVALPSPSRVKVIAVDREQTSDVVRCAQIPCRIALPAGRYRLFAPGTDLMQAPVEVRAGVVTELALDAL